MLDLSTALEKLEEQLKAYEATCLDKNKKPYSNFRAGVHNFFLRKRIGGEGGFKRLQTFREALASAKSDFADTEELLEFLRPYARSLEESTFYLNYIGKAALEIAGFCQGHIDFVAYEWTRSQAVGLQAAGVAYHAPNDPFPQQHALKEILSEIFSKASGNIYGHNYLIKLNRQIRPKMEMKPVDLNTHNDKNPAHIRRP